MNKETYISIVIPVFNEEDSLKELYEQLSTVMGSIKKKYEIIFVDDGSTDEGISILRSFKEGSDAVKILSFSRNFGQHAAVIAGFKVSRGKIVVTLDADLQNPPQEIPKLINKI